MQNTNLLSKQQLKLIDIAKLRAKKCYKEGITSMATVLQAQNGQHYTGINIKYHKVWKCVCAERVAIAKALEAGETEFDTIVTVKYFPETDEYTVINMCGEYRQLAQFHPGLKVIVDDKGILKLKSIQEILPFAYANK